MCYTAARLSCWVSLVFCCQCFIASFPARQYAGFSRLSADPPFDLLYIPHSSFRCRSRRHYLVLALSSTSGRVLGSLRETGP
ncbi:hypothetical protein M440DRAFT_91205 [Trichoderma longibrachiatum ATCC 18648]|uniref:Secreted protein n=1 Tax=Trichoderma longibrachiatum ATCC 18648 TaxID=983965 RepID=A0A2T4CJG9_TRILO|nr:hypothetical protein M440DRAFT_91205 [Trichoderma longibrachiatum ATCC 18648]